MEKSGAFVVQTRWAGELAATQVRTFSTVEGAFLRYLDSMFVPIFGRRRNLVERGSYLHPSSNHLLTSEEARGLRAGSLQRQILPYRAEARNEALSHRSATCFVESPIIR